MTFHIPNKLQTIFLLLIVLGPFFHLPTPLAARETADKFYTVEVWKFSTKDSAFRAFETLTHWLPPDKRDHMRIELVRGSFSLRVGKTKDKLMADQLVELVAERYTSANLLKSQYDRSRFVKLYRTSHETPAQPILSDPEIAAKPVPLTPLPALKKPSPKAVVVSQEQAPIDTFVEPALPEPDQKVFTIQAGSFKNIKRAKKHYNDLEWLLNPSQRGLLRIEQVKGFTTVRVGSFTTEAAARPLLTKIKELEKSAHILHTQILESRIEQLYREPSL